MLTNVFNPDLFFRIVRFFLMETVYVLKLTNNFSSGLINRNSRTNNVLLTKKLSHAKTFVTKNNAESFAKKVVDDYSCKVFVDILQVSMEVVK